ncbi:MAG: UvrD-helicase domain-containing protein [Thermoleophilia bacterium]|nr:UvrD-helicase domain-containing protein [Thermoleophilia bacterium]
MQPHEILISDDEIEFAEQILFGQTGIFDDERKEFIKNIETIDLQAVPGSGKTTALLAKLLILERFLPFDDGSGILVISHTNAAIDEIRDKIGAYCPRLFSYPNYIGTIQSFVDKYLALPYYVNKYGQKPYRIDNEIYDEKVIKYYEALSSTYGMRAWLDRQNDPLIILKKIRLDQEENLIPALNKVEADFPLTDKTGRSYLGIKKMKTDLLEWGYLHFDDAYYLASKYLSEYPSLIEILRKRFKYVFVDEMQDMDKHQHDLLEKIFFHEEVIFQRIGDKNQAIFSPGVVMLDMIWQGRDNTLSLIGSHRLSPRIAETVKYFGLEYLEIEGRKTNDDGTEIDIKPHMIIYDEGTITHVLEEFTKIVEALQQAGAIPGKLLHPVKAIGWRAEHDDADKYGIKDYHNEYERSLHRKRIDFPTLMSYISMYDKETGSLQPLRCNIINALLTVLRLEQMFDENGRACTRRGLLNHLREEFPERYEEFKLKLYEWSIGAYSGNVEAVHEAMKGYLPTFFSEVFGLETLKDESLEFINSNAREEIFVDEAAIGRSNVFTGENEIEVEIGTVHSVKGETHTATLYLETYYQGREAYESKRLSKQFSKEKFDDTRVHHRQSVKMIYVGFSRPSYLLCFAVHKDRIPEIVDEEWVIIDLSMQ